MYDHLDREFPCATAPGKNYTRDGYSQQVWPDGAQWRTYHLHTDGTRCRMVRDGEGPFRLDTDPPDYVRLPGEK